ncbi:uncharacterized protein NFIA_065140 [Aspergillus fischeri NRRL 181]|uniref:Uncharacterized protein n=1 Tax=Neosartorya fischeri (strain ATCC 1020 / DSM 3700 / CBS 544.65 / FGSC A1164 / JCM 1740 / NRRL 181 / WB 181) TaxID=331117 RepID=A1D6K6_NEOFI|nr:uncharacterized protein NFIA_065140 [Aspergillus fischeri NRRL 181]EAW21350.1 hypothetical protein NFIA_065140 [Aspergillus fischeri NRRL 181]KAG2016928.1 hypothetical protein GB937_005830 [Aspergillus fischeri]
MTPSTPFEKANHLINCLQKHGQGDYIGQIIPLDSTREIHLRMNLKNNQSVGPIGHETPGAEYPPRPGLQFLTAVDSAYYDSLSAASKKSLEFQGGPFSGAELATFEADPLREEMVLLRLWDDSDRAKVLGIEGLTPRAGEYLDDRRAFGEGGWRWSCRWTWRWMICLAKPNRWRRRSRVVD